MKNIVGLIGLLIIFQKSLWFKKYQNCSWQRKKLSKPKIEKEWKDDIIKNIRNIFKLKKESKAIKDKIVSDIRNLFELEIKDY